MGLLLLTLGKWLIGLQKWPLTPLLPYTDILLIRAGMELLPTQHLRQAHGQKARDLFLSSLTLLLVGMQQWWLLWYMSIGALRCLLAPGLVPHRRKIVALLLCMTTLLTPP